MVNAFSPWTPPLSFGSPSVLPAAQPSPHELFQTAEILSNREKFAHDDKDKDQLRNELTAAIGAYARQANETSALYAVERFRPGSKMLIAITRECYAEPSRRPVAFAPLMNRCAVSLPAYDFLVVLLRDMILTRAEVFSYIDIVAKLPTDDIYAHISRHEKLCGLIHLLSQVLPEHEISKLLNHHGLTDKDLWEFRQTEYYKSL